MPNGTSTTPGLTRWVCGLCQSNETWAHYEHQGCPQAPPWTNVYAWETEAYKGPDPDGRPQPQPCPGCETSPMCDCQYVLCRNCNTLIASW